MYVFAGGDSDGSFSQNWWVETLHLADTDRHALLSGGELSDAVINAAQKMLATQYPNISGLQDTNRGRRLMFSSSPRNCIQIFHIGELVHAVYLHVQCSSRKFLKTGQNCNLEKQGGGGG